jgi:hypothetical protein
LIAGAVIGGIASSAYGYGPGYGYGYPGHGYYGGYSPAYYGGYDAYPWGGYTTTYYSGGYAPAYYGPRYSRVVRPAFAYYGGPYGRHPPSLAPPSLVIMARGAFLRVGAHMRRADFFL